MTKTIIVAALIWLSMSFRFDYRLDQAAKTWLGHQHALHYFDHFKFLGQHSSNLTGIMTTAYKLKAKQEFHLSLSLTVGGDLTSEHDGFLVLLSPRPFLPKDLEYQKNEVHHYQTKFQDTTQHLDINGFYVLTTGGFDRSIYSGYHKDDLVITKDFARNCRGTHGKKFHLMITLVSGVITLSVDLENEAGLVTCQSFPAPDWDEEFHLSFMARSAWHSNVEFEVSDLLFSSDTENHSVGLFHDVSRYKDHRMFHKIHFFRANEHLIDTSTPDIESKRLNLTVLARMQDTVYTHLDRCNHIIAKNMESSQRIVDFLELQNSVVSQYADSIISSIQGLVNGTVARFAAIERDSNFIINEYQEFNLDGEFQSARRVIDQLRQTVRNSVDKLRVLEQFPETTLKNLAYLQSHEADLKALPEKFQEFLRAIRLHDSRASEIRLLMTLAGAGAVAMAALLAVFWRLGTHRPPPAV